jgi:hypothetical protein
MEAVRTITAAFAAVAALVACNSSKDSAGSADSTGSGAIAYVADLQPLNTTVTGTETRGTARLVINGDSLTITTDVKGAPASMMHLQHFHGFVDNHDAVCPTAAADTNHDGVIDIHETEPVVGVTMVPFTTDPVSMQIVTNTYPTADSSGSFHYTKTVALLALDSAFKKTFNDADLDLGNRVVMIHGVPDSTKLKPSVSSLGNIPAQVTIPIACGKLVRSGS